MLKKTTLALLLATSITACSSGEPSAGDIKSALEEMLNEANSAADEMVGDFGAGDLMDQYKVEIRDVEKLSCNAASGASGFVCDVKVTSFSEFTGEQSAASSIRLVESDGGWEIIQ